MDAAAQKEKVRTWIHGVWDRADFDLLTSMASSDYVFRTPGLDDLRGEGFIGYVGAVRAAFPDLSNTIEAQVAEADTVVTRGTTRGTQTGAFGDIPASGRSVAVPWVIVTKFADGLIVEDWELYDGLGLMRQIGVLPG